MTSIPIYPAPVQPLWKTAQWAGLGLTVVLLGALLAHPVTTLHVLWDMVIPLLPAVFLVNPLVWRNVCPLATIESLAAKLSASRRLLEGRTARFAWSGGIVLLALMVPARRFVFNTNGPVLALTIVIVATLATAGGVLFARRGGFCNAVCPVLPVEKLYGQSPLLRVGTARCASCSACTPVGCIELANDKTVRQTVGPKRRDGMWFLTSFGAFAAAFPGFIIGYFTTTDGSLESSLDVYARVFGLAALSYVVVTAAARWLRIRFDLALAALGAISIALYYFYAAPAIAKAYGAPEAGPLLLRVGAFALIGVWAAGFLRRSRPAVE